MNESEFRDWARRAQGDFNERLKALERQVGALKVGPPPRIGGRLAAGQVALAEELLRAVKGGGVEGLAIAYLGPDGPIDGWSCSGGVNALHTLLGAVVSLTDELLHPEKERVTTFGADDGEAAGAASGSAGGQTDEGNPPGREARGLAGPAPAGQA